MQPKIYEDIILGKDINFLLITIDKCYQLNFN